MEDAKNNVQSVLPYRRKKSQYFRVLTLVGKQCYLKSKQGDSKLSVRAAHSPYKNETEHILEQDLPTGKRLISNSGKEGVDCVTVRTGEKEKENNKKENKFFSSSVNTIVNLLQTMLGSCSSSRWLHGRPNHQQTQNF